MSGSPLNPSSTATGTAIRAAPTAIHSPTIHSNVLSVPAHTSSENGFQRALKAFTARLTPTELSQFKVTTVDELKVMILAIQSEQRARKEMRDMGRLQSFLEAMEQFGKVIEVFLNAADMVAWVWGPMKFLLLTASNWSETFDSLLDAYHLISESLPIFENYQGIFIKNDRMQTVLENVWSDILDFHRQVLRIFGQSMIRQFFRAMWKDFKTRFSHILADLKRQKELVESHANQIHIQNYEVDRIKIFEEFAETKRKRDQERFMFVSQWVSSPHSIQFHEDVSAVRETFYESTGYRTGHWLVDHEEVKAWLGPMIPKSSILWINGNAGTGKTVLSSAIIETIREKKAHPLAFLYCKHRDPERSTVLSVMKGILIQLLSQQRQLLPYYYDEALGSGEVSLQSGKLCKKLLRHLLQNLRRGFLVIDGLDECEVAERKAIMDFCNEIINTCDSKTPGKLRLLVLSRDEPDIKRYLAGASFLKIAIQDTAIDIQHFVEYRAGAVQTQFNLSQSDREYIEQHVLDKTQGMFLYAKLVMNNLYGQASVQDLREELRPDIFPSGLEEAYKRNFHRIQSNPQDGVKAATRRVLALMLCCRRPLRWREIQAAVSVNARDQTVDGDKRLRFTIHDICGSLVEILSGDRIELAHTTVSHYMVACGYLSVYSAECLMANLCLYYLALECFAEGVDTDERSSLAIKGHFAFQDYAVAHWADHTLGALGLWTTCSTGAKAGDELEEVKDIHQASTIFTDRYYTDLISSMAHNSSQPSSSSITQQSPYYPSLHPIWNHATNFTAYTDDRRDEISLKSLRTVIMQNRVVLENLRGSALSNFAELKELYGQNLFKCRRLRCFYFHEGFKNESLRKAHYDRHDRPFRCAEEDCPASAIGFGSLKELDKHKRNTHPGIDKLSSTFARLRKGASDINEEMKYPCPRCPEKFKTRLECRFHMSSHNPVIHPKSR